MPTSFLNEPKPLNDPTSTSWLWELARLLRYVSILTVVAINKLKEKE